jgi:hypothetical protein
LHRLYNGAGAGIVIPSGVEEAHKDLVENDLIENLDLWNLRQCSIESPGVGAAAVDEFCDARPAK